MDGKFHFYALLPLEIILKRLIKMLNIESLIKFFISFPSSKDYSIISKFILFHFSFSFFFHVFFFFCARCSRPWLYCDIVSHTFNIHIYIHCLHNHQIWYKPTWIHTLHPVSNSCITWEQRSDWQPAFLLRYKRITLVSWVHHRENFTCYSWYFNYNFLQMTLRVWLVEHKDRELFGV